MFGPALKPLARIVLTLAIVWFYQGLTTAYFDGVVQVVIVVLLAIPTWIVVGRAVFPTGDNPLLQNGSKDFDPPDSGENSDCFGRD